MENLLSSCPAGYLTEEVAALSAKLAKATDYNDQNVKEAMDLAQRIGEEIRKEFAEEWAEVSKKRSYVLENYLTSRTGGMAILAQIEWNNSNKGKIADVFRGVAAFHREMMLVRSQKAEEKRRAAMEEEATRLEAETKRQMEQSRLAHIEMLAENLLVKYLPISMGEVCWYSKQMIRIDRNLIELKEGVYVTPQLKRDINVDIDETMKRNGYVFGPYGAYTEGAIHRYKSYIQRFVYKGVMEQNKEIIERIYRSVREQRLEAEARRRLKAEEYEAAVRAKMGKLRLQQRRH